MVVVGIMVVGIMAVVIVVVAPSISEVVGMVIPTGPGTTAVTVIHTDSLNLPKPRRRKASQKRVATTRRRALCFVLPTQRLMDSLVQPSLRVNKTGVPCHL